MPRSRNKKLHNRCLPFCHTCRLSVSSSSPEEVESSNESDELQTVSSIAHAMVQERLDQMIRERSGRPRNEEMKLVVMVAMEKCSYDPREDFRESIEHVIVVNRIQETNHLRQLLNYYLLMNSEEFRRIILEVFHEVCTDLFVHF